MESKQGFSRRQFLKFSSMVGAGAFLAACAPAAAPSAGGGEGAVPAAATVMIRYQSREPENAAGVQELWDEFYPVFREENPGIEIEFMPSAGGDIRENAVTQMVAGDAPDLLEFCCQNSTYFMQIGETMNLQPSIDRDADEVNIDDYYTHQFDPWMKDGDIHLMPRFTGTQLIYYNKDMFDAADIPYPSAEWGSWDWEEYTEIGKAFVGEGPPPTWGSSSYGMNANWLTQYWLRNFGGHMVDPEDNTRCGLGDPECVEALDWIRKIIWDDNMFAYQSSIAASGLGVLELFLGQRIGMMEMGPWNLGPVADGAIFKWDVAPMPDGPAGNSTHQSVDGTFVWQGTEYPDESWTVLKNTTSPWYGELYAKYATKQPSRKSVLPKFAELLREQDETLQ